MRIIAGREKGRRLAVPGRGTETLLRPTSDRAREAIFSIISDDVNGATVLDLFAGTGAFGLEALSRGASYCCFVENSPAACSVLQKNIEMCNFLHQARLVRHDLTKGLSFLQGMVSGTVFDIIFLDPPYETGLAETVIRSLAEMQMFYGPESIIIAEEKSGIDLPERVSGLVLQQRRRYGAAAFWFYQPTDEVMHERL